MIEDTDPTGAVFVPIQGKGQRPAWSFGPDGQATKEVMFTCPMSAIPETVWQLLAVWNACRLMRVLPVGGGLLEQPVWVQRFFPILDAEYRRATAGQGNAAAEHAAALAVGAMVKVMQPAGGR